MPDIPGRGLVGVLPLLISAFREVRLDNGLREEYYRDVWERKSTR